MASGTSSIIKSTPVAASIALIFLPSRPIKRPFISSFGNEMLVTVASETTSAANRCATRREASWCSVFGVLFTLRSAAPAEAQLELEGLSFDAHLGEGR